MAVLSALGQARDTALLESVTLSLLARVTRDSYIGGLPFRVEGSPLSSIAANGS
jgi:hypothetical protein